MTDTERYLIFALQVIRNGRIVDYSEANHYLKEIMAFPSNEWNALDGEFSKIYTDLTNKLDSATTFNLFYTQFEIEAYSRDHVKTSVSFLLKDPIG
jgi:hypothetical protein